MPTDNEHEEDDEIATGKVDENATAHEPCLKDITNLISTNDGAKVSGGEAETEADTGKTKEGQEGEDDQIAILRVDENATATEPYLENTINLNSTNDGPKISGEAENGKEPKKNTR